MCTDLRRACKKCCGAGSVGSTASMRNNNHPAAEENNGKNDVTIELANLDGSGGIRGTGDEDTIDRIDGHNQSRENDNGRNNNSGDDNSTSGNNEEITEASYSDPVGASEASLSVVEFSGPKTYLSETGVVSALPNALKIKLDKQNRKREREKKRQEQLRRATNEAEARLIQDAEERMIQDLPNTADTGNGTRTFGPQVFTVNII
ncbi:hypothetical protein BZA77DRAFT_298145 [Pyronema omphalodes]|nr:hypothetical protein BZA77DRAFT_298145 [Pyronema omphalodes]